MDSCDRFVSSCEHSNTFPKCLDFYNVHDDHEDYFQRLDERENALFSGEHNATIEIWEHDKDSDSKLGSVDSRFWRMC